jgi:hypothetical protein
MRTPRCGVPDGVAVFDPSEKYDAKGGVNKWNNPGQVKWRVINAPAGKTIGEVTAVAQLAFNAWEATTSINFDNEPPTGGPNRGPLRRFS